MEDHLNREPSKFKNETAGLPGFTNGSANKTGTGQQKRALRKLLHDLIAFTGTAINDLAATPRKAPQRNRQRLLYRRADSLTDADLDMLVVEIGIGRWWAAAERATQPQLPLQAAE